MSSFPEGRFYEAEFPQLDEVVVVQVKRIVEMGAYVNLLEYNGKEGMMLLSELSKRRIRSVAKLLRVGRTEVCRVLRVDEEKGYIDLSKRRVAPEEAQEKEEAFAKAKAVHGIMRHVAKENEIDVEDLCMKLSWPLYVMNVPAGVIQEVRGREAYECFRKHVAEEINVWELCDFSKPGADLTHLEAKIKDEIEIHLKRRLIQQRLRIRAKVEVGCDEYEGIDAIKRALIKGQSAVPPKVEADDASKKEEGQEFELKIKLIAHPLFVVSCECREKEKGLEITNNAMELIKESITSEGGVYSEREAAHVVNAGQHDEDEEPGSSSGESGSASDVEHMDVDDAKLGLADPETTDDKKEKKEKKEKKKKDEEEEEEEEED